MIPSIRIEIRYEDFNNEWHADIEIGDEWLFIARMSLDYLLRSIAEIVKENVEEKK